MMPSWLSLADVFFVVVVGLFAVGGYQKGIAAQLAHVGTFFLAGVLLFFAYPFLFSYLGSVFRGLEETYLMWVLLAALLLISIGLYMLFTKLLAGLIRFVISERVDALWGLAGGLVRGLLTVLVVMILLVMVDRTGGAYDQLRARSYIGRVVCNKLVPRIQPHLVSLYRDKIMEWENPLLEREEAASEVDM